MTAHPCSSRNDSRRPSISTAPFVEPGADEHDVSCSDGRQRFPHRWSDRRLRIETACYHDEAASGIDRSIETNLPAVDCKRTVRREKPGAGLEVTPTRPVEQAVGQLRKRRHRRGISSEESTVALGRRLGIWDADHLAEEDRHVGDLADVRQALGLIGYREAGRRLCRPAPAPASTRGSQASRRPGAHALAHERRHHDARRPRRSAGGRSRQRFAISDRNVVDRVAHQFDLARS